MRFFFLICFNILCYASGFYMLVFVVRCLCCARVRARVCVIHWHCSAQLSMFNMEKRYRNKIIIIIIIISFHARVGCFSPCCIRWSVAIAVILFWLHLVVLVSPCFLGPRISRDYRFPRAPLFLCSKRKLWKVMDRQLKLQFGDRQTRVKTVHNYSEDRNSRCDAT